MKLCEKCGKLMGYNSYFGGYYCTSCGKLEIAKGQKFTLNHVRGNLKDSTLRGLAVSRK